MSNGIVHEGVVEHRHYNDLPHKIKLIRGMKGQYGWEITIAGNDQLEMKEMVGKINASLEIDYVRKQVKE